MKLLKQFAKYATGSLFSLLAGLITTPILTRLISTDEMGKYSMFITIGSLAASILYLGLDQSYVRFYYDEDEKSRVYLLNRCIILPVIISIAISALTVILYKWITPVMIGEQSFVLALIFAFYLVGLVIDRFWLLKIRMGQKAGAYSVLNVIRKLSYLVIAVILFYTFTGDSSWSLIIAVTAAEAVLMGCAYWVERKEWKTESRELKTSYEQILKYGFPFVFSTTVTLVFHSTDKLMLKALSDFNQIGLYSGAQNIVNLLTQVQVMFATFWVPVAFEHYSKHPEDKGFFIRANEIISYGMLIVAIALLCLKDVVVLFLGGRYREAVFVFPFLSFMPIMYTVSEVTVGGINFKKKSSYHVWMSLICAVVNAVGNYFLIKAFGAKGAAISTGFSYVVFYILRTVLANKVYPVKYKVGKFLSACVLVYGLAIIASFYKVTIWFLVIAAIIIGIISLMYKDVLKEAKVLLPKVIGAIKGKIKK